MTPRQRAQGLVDAWCQQRVLDYQNLVERIAAALEQAGQAERVECERLVQIHSCLPGLARACLLDTLRGGRCSWLRQRETTTPVTQDEFR